MKTAAGSKLEGLYAAHIDAAVRLAYLMTGNREQAEDLAQEAFVKIAGRFYDLRSEEAFGAYLRTTVVNLSRGHLRRLRTQRDYLRRQRAEDETVRPYDPSEGSDTWAALQRLAHRQRAALVLRYYEDLSERQTADALGCSVSAVKSLVSRGLAELRAHMSTGEEA